MSSAVISECGKYRYVLKRRIPQLVRWIKPCLFIMLNPSKADATINDPTIKRCINFATSWLCTELTVVNLFAYRATKPKELLAVDDPIGPENDRYLKEEIDKHMFSGNIIAGWGNNAFAEKQANHLYSLINPNNLRCLIQNKNGSPRHPLYIKGDCQPKEYVITP